LIEYKLCFNMSQLEVIKYIETSLPKKKVDLMFKLNDERGHIPTEIFSILRHQDVNSPDQESKFSQAIQAMGFETHTAFLEYVRPTLD